MIKRLRSLMAELLMAILVAFLVAILTFILVQRAGEGIVNEMSSSSSYQKKEYNRCFESLQSFVNEHQLALAEVGRLSEWEKKESYVVLSLYNNNRVIYPMDEEFRPEDLANPENFEPSKPNRILRFSDGTAEVDLFCFYQIRYYYLVTLSAWAVAAINFVLVLILLIRRKLNYIRILQNEVRILEGGALDYQITQIGRDEIADLARAIEQMRLSLNRQWEIEETTRKSNEELITALSHDMRTPLTSILGYLDLMNRRKDLSNAEKEHYLSCVRQKAYQMKEMTDQLFRYSYLYAQHGETELQPAPAGEWLRQVLSEKGFELENNGFSVQLEIPELRGTILVNDTLFARVFDNLFSNILKYADAASPVVVKAQQTGTLLNMSMTNAVNTRLSRSESTKIGIKTCEQILLSHRGHFETFEENGFFSALLSLPISESAEDQTDKNMP